ncbi:glycosyltransferase family 4 protein [Paucibacter sp. TC2R-5]|uniref:glycosyltransferase family 4 protein n=1 Tax=Paucibacter sp. TC2R-5 TaxID=2893555 RepID=UPI0021E4A653|nr:glycosyltransferase family 1 protein [Paucibacter sp. TC2R-5]MCV2359831.1 glycosyltransferase family 4 protein [Paucibacter sp. TC2R-5]
MKILLEMRPALDGHSGIPQEARLLFRGLAGMDDVDVLGLLQSGNLVLDAGLATTDLKQSSPVNSAAEIDRLSRVVVSLQQGPASHRFEHWRKRLLRIAGPLAAAAAALMGRKIALSRFDPAHFKDFVWRAMFAKSLPVEDFDSVTSREFRVMRWPWSAMNAVGVASAALGHAVYPRLNTRSIDVMIAETPYPGRVSRGTRMIVRYHDAIPLLMPHTIKDRGYHRAMHFHALKRNAADGAWFACVSEATRRDLLSVLPEVEGRAVTIPNMVSHHYVPEQGPPSRVPEIIWSRKNRQAPHEGGADVYDGDLQDGALPYLLMVCTVEPRKNHQALLDAWELLRTQGYSQLNLICVGSMGWDHEAILRRFTPWLRRGGLHLLHDVPPQDLRLLYRHAQVTVCPSFGEGFDFSGVEAMCSGGVVAASDIQVHKDVYGAAAEYFSAYSPQEMAAVLDRLMGPESAARRAELRCAGGEVTAQYRPAVVLPQWQDFLHRVCGEQ